MSLFLSPRRNPRVYTLLRLEGRGGCAGGGPKSFRVNSERVQGKGIYFLPEISILSLHLNLLRPRFGKSHFVSLPLDVPLIATLLPCPRQKSSQRDVYPSGPPAERSKTYSPASSTKCSSFGRANFATPPARALQSRQDGGGRALGVAARVEYTSVANSADRSLINRSHYQATSECAWPRLCEATMYTGMYLKPLSSEFPSPIRIRAQWPLCSRVVADQPALPLTLAAAPPPRRPSAAAAFPLRPEQGASQVGL